MQLAITTQTAIIKLIDLSSLAHAQLSNRKELQNHWAIIYTTADEDVSLIVELIIFCGATLSEPHPLDKSHIQLMGVVL